jgi:hypothetical protein
MKASLRRGRLAGEQVGAGGGERASDVRETPVDAAPLKAGPEQPLSLGAHETNGPNVTGNAGTHPLTAGAPSAPTLHFDSDEFDARASPSSLTDAALLRPTANDGSQNECAPPSERPVSRDVPHA